MYWAFRFEVSEPLSWSTVNIKKARIDFQSSPMFSGKIGGLADHVEYAGDRVWYKVSTVTTRYQFERARQAVLLDSEGYVESLWRQLKAELKKLSTLSKGVDDKEINRVRAKIAELKAVLRALARVTLTSVCLMPLRWVMTHPTRSSCGEIIAVITFIFPSLRAKHSKASRT